jgi:hypothetical protein
MPVQAAKDIRPPHYSGVNYRVVIRIGRYDKRSWTGIDYLRHLSGPQIAQVFGYFFIREFRDETHPVMAQHPR